jgi:hypothetical protein
MPSRNPMPQLKGETQMSVVPLKVIDEVSADRVADQVRYERILAATPPLLPGKYETTELRLQPPGDQSIELLGELSPEVIEASCVPIVGLEQAQIILNGVAKRHMGQVVQDGTEPC